jgi:hypothetical protein
MCHTWVSNHNSKDSACTKFNVYIWQHVMNFLGAVKSVFCLDVNPTSTHHIFGQACSDSSLLGSKNEIPGFSAHGSLSIWFKTRNNTNLHLPTVNITKFYKGLCISGSKSFNHLPRHTKFLANDMKSFKTSLKEIFISSFFLFSWRILWILWWRGHVNTYCKICDFIWFSVLSILLQPFNILCLKLI